MINFNQLKDKWRKKRAYNKMIRKHRKILTRDARHAQPYDYGFFLEMFIHGLEFMRDYYHLGINVVGMEDKEWDETKKDAPTREESLNNALEAYYNSIDGNKDDKFYATNVVPLNKLNEIHTMDTIIQPKEPYKTANEALEAEWQFEEKEWIKFCESIKTDIKEWWD